MIERPDNVIEVERDERHAGSMVGVVRRGVDIQPRQTAIIRNHSSETALKRRQAGDRLSGELAEQCPQRGKGLRDMLGIATEVSGIQLERINWIACHKRIAAQSR